MELFRAVIFVIVGFVILWKSAELLVSAAVSIAEHFGVSALVVGLTVVAMGTSAPEAAASIAAAIKAEGSVAVGNVYGSNIANLALVGGIASLIRPIRVRSTVLKREIPIMLGTALLLWPVVTNLRISRVEGIFLLVIFTMLLVVLIRFRRRRADIDPLIKREAADRIQKQVKVLSKPLKVCVLFVLVGLFGLAVGADIAIRGAVNIGARMGISQAVIGSTIIAVGTSLPELVTCVVASLKRQDDISIGNLIGSNVFNTLLVVGSASAVRPLDISERLAGADYRIMVGISFVFAAAVLIGRLIIKRPLGLVLLLSYAAYMVYLLGYTRTL